MQCFLMVLLGLMACQEPAKDPGRVTGKQPTTDSLYMSYHFGYDLEKPYQTITLPSKLVEISGLGITEDGKHLLAVQDEDGIIFKLDKQTGRVVDEIKFWKAGDYEGIEVVGKDIYVAKSSGTIYRVSDLENDEPTVDKFNFFLNSENNVEGLGYDPHDNRLLLACKAKAGDGKEFRMKKAIYSFDLKKMELEAEPAYLLSLDEIHRYLDTSPDIRNMEKIVEFFTPNQSEFTFSPSGIAIHPRTKDIYILSSVGKVLVIMNRKGKVMHIEKMKKKIHHQPEGICFDKDGTLYISNEGGRGIGKIYRFAYRK